MIALTPDDQVTNLVKIVEDLNTPQSLEVSLMHKEGKDMNSIRSKYNISRDTFVVDSGATSHMRFSKEGMTDLIKYKSPIKIGNAEDMYSEMIGTFKGKVIQGNGTIMDLVLHDVLYVPDLYINLFSLTKVLNNRDIDIKKEKNTLAIIFNNKKIIFDKHIPVGKGRLIGIEIFAKDGNNHQTAMLSYTELHDILGHPHEKVLKATAKKYKIALSGRMTPCDDCARAKLRKTNIPKEAQESSTIIGERISFDISTVATSSHAGNCFWLLIMDEFTKYCWSIFLNTKVT
jgi:hypothetical protein